LGKSPAVVNVIANVENKEVYYNKKLYYCRASQLWPRTSYATSGQVASLQAYTEGLGDHATAYRWNKEVAGIMNIPKAPP
jgi:hypothetical protein